MARPKKNEVSAAAEDPIQVTTIRIPERWHEVLRERAFKERRPINDLIKDALRDKYGLKIAPLA